MRYRSADVVVIGGGLAGLAIARKLGDKALVLEKNEEVGGLCRSFTVDGFLFDFGGHVLHGDKELFISPGFPDLFAFVRKASITWQGRRIPYPVQTNAYALPDQARQECMSAFLETRFRDCSLDEQLPAEGVFPNHYDALVASYGRGFVNLFFSPYHEKLMGSRLRDLSGSLWQRFIPITTVRQVLLGAFRPHDDHKIGYNAEALYPSGGMQALVDHLCTQVMHYETNQKVTAVDLHNKRLCCEAGDQFDYRWLISTMPLPELLSIVSPVPQSIVDKARRVHFRSVWLVAVAVEGKCPVDDHWLYVSDQECPFHRVVFPGNIVSSTTVPGHYSLLLECATSENANPQFPHDLSRVLDHLVELGLLRHAEDAVVLGTKVISPAYVVPSVIGDELSIDAAEHLRQYDVMLAGRYGTWSYLSISDLIQQAERIANEFS